MSTNCPVISTQKNLKENQLHGSHDFPVDIHMDYFPVSESGEHTLYVPMHWHPEVEFHYQLQGSVRIQVELTEYVSTRRSALDQCQTAARLSSCGK